ncbi:MAG TPA: response regulator transcription factor, partial [Longimicrobiaceae bacterium]|nr:response regulator transcription factor [Longimicrobiaceae bacterium]
REAAAQYARALRHADHLPPAERARLLEAQAYEYYLTDQISESLAARRAALDLWRAAGDRTREGDTLRWLSRLNWFLGENAEAERAGRAALDVLQPLPPGRELAMAFSNWSQLRMLSHDLPEAVAWGERAIALAGELGDTATLAHALNNVGTATLNSDYEKGRALLERSLSLSLEAGLEEHAARAYTNLGSEHVVLHRFPQADQYLEQGIGYCAEHDLDSWRLYMLGWLAVSGLHRGRWTEAEEAATAVLQHPRVSSVSRMQALVVLGRIAARRGEFDRTAYLDEALALASGTGELQRLAPACAAHAELAWLSGERNRAERETRTALELALARRDPWRAGELLSWLARADERVEAPEWIARPYALELAGDRAGAAAEWKGRGCDYEAARALAGGDDAEGLRAALEEFERLGARPAAQHVLRRLRELGVRGVPRGPRPSTRANPGGLTRREAEIARLIASGLRNGEIAKRLFLAPKTVDHHVSSVLAKLGVRTRMEAAREAERLGLLQTGGAHPPK